MTNQTPSQPTVDTLLLSQTKKGAVSCWKNIAKDMMYFVIFLTGLGLTMTTTSCKSKDFEITQINSGEHSKNFVEGRTELSLGGLAAAGGSGYFPTMKKLWIKKDWAELSKLVISANTNLDYAWFMLGESARGLGLTNVAEIYYRRALETASNMGGSCMRADTCQGFSFPRDINLALAALQTRGIYQGRTYSR